MKVLNQQETNSISGGANLVITQQISTADISEQCVALIASMFQGTKTDEQMVSHILSGCTFDELDILDDRFDAAAFTTVEFK